MAPVTTSGLATSWTHTPQAGDDDFAPSGLGEDAAAVFYLDVMANDLGGKARTLYALDDGLENQDSAASPDLLTADLVGAENLSRCGALIQITVERTVSVTLTGTNDAPVIELGVGDSAAGTLTETDSGLSIGGTVSASQGHWLNGNGSSSLAKLSNSAIWAR